jgi:predicted HD superfamily hydrolase involved in NAD metabolism
MLFTSNAQPLTSLEARARDWVRQRLSTARFAHTEGVVITATAVAARYTLDPTPLRLAGWIHDAAKELPDAELLAEAKRLGCTIRPVERAAPFLLHGRVAIGLAREALGIDDPAVSSAVETHTTGDPAMSTPDKVFYLADLIEPSRTFGWIAQARALVEAGTTPADLDVALLFALTCQLRRLLKRGALIDPRAIALHNRLLLDGVPLVPRRES